jgi:endonuclease IV
MDIDVGLKRFPLSLSDLKDLKKHMDHLEVMAIPGSNYDVLNKLDLPITIHAPHISQGFNPASKKLEGLNEDLLNHALSVADMFSSSVVVVHPGHIVDKQCSVDFSVDFFNSRIDRRMRFENLENGDGAFSDFNKFKLFLSKLKHKKVCFDISHAYLSSLKLGVEPFGHIKKFFSLEPDYFHLSGINFARGRDHFNFSNNDFAYKKIVPYFPRNPCITLETNHLNGAGKLNTIGQIRDLDFTRKLFL